MRANVAIRRADKCSPPRRFRPPAELIASMPAIYEASGHKFNVFVSIASGFSNYNTSSFGWNPQSEKLEMFDPWQSRFIIAHVDGGARDSVPDIYAYTIFRFDREERQTRPRRSTSVTLGSKVAGSETADIDADGEGCAHASQSALSFYTSVGSSGELREQRSGHA
ncbi:hypothetical protein SCLCIDRAFT_7710 [Scleroderma citrinum Foug A]|uniref:Uncharacterized protein n=1 Tax=Scleroderma citrinum Foug A TaxID=1036808 RepID=A0A0C3AQP7_9AGAM|nr:hypothetical protein SCLCIDRAFT_7710 [Scleroderma citrinum Foug A]